MQEKNLSEKPDGGWILIDIYLVVTIVVAIFCITYVVYVNNKAKCKIKKASELINVASTRIEEINKYEKKVNYTTIRTFDIRSEEYLSEISQIANNDALRFLLYDLKVRISEPINSKGIVTSRENALALVNVIIGIEHVETEIKSCRERYKQILFQRENNGKV